MIDELVNLEPKLLEVYGEVAGSEGSGKVLVNLVHAQEKIPVLECRPVLSKSDLALDSAILEKEGGSCKQREPWSLAGQRSASEMSEGLAQSLPLMQV